MYTTFLLYYSSSKFSKFIQGKSPLLQQLTSVSLLKKKIKMCPKLIELLPGMARTFMFAALCQHAHPLKHSLAQSKKQRKNLRQQGHSLPEVSLYQVSEHTVCVVSSVHSSLSGLWLQKCCFRCYHNSCLTFWRRNYFFKFQHILYIQSE